MLKILAVIAISLLLSGCPGPMDRIPSYEPATVKIRDGQVCITAATKPGEYLASVEISDGENNNFDKTLNVQTVMIYPGDCFPTFGYYFKSGHNYIAHFAVAKSRAERSHHFSVEFTVNSQSINQVKPLVEE